MKKLIILTVSVLAFFGCKTEDTPGNPYEGADYIYIESKDANNRDLLQVVTHSWSSFSSPETVYTFTVKTVGNIYDYDREFKVKVSTGSNLPEASLYSVSEFVIPANESEVVVNVTMLRDDEFFLANYGYESSVTFEIEENEHFKIWPTNGYTFMTYNINISKYYWAG